MEGGWLMMDGGGLRIFPSPEVTHRPRTTVTDCRLRSGKVSWKKANYFKNFTDLQPRKALLPTVTFSSELSMMTSRFLQF